MVKSKNMFNKIGLIMALLLISIMSVNAVTTLNGCGNSAWTNGETYLLNFTLIDNTYGNDYCFLFNNQNYQDLIFTNVGEIEISKTGNFYFMYAVDGAFGNAGLNNILLNFTINDLILSDISTSGNKYMFRTLTGGATEHAFSMENFKINNLTINNFYALGFFKLGFLYNSQISNSNLNMEYLADGVNNGVLAGVYGNIFNDSLLILNSGFEINVISQDQNKFNRSVLIVTDYNTVSHVNFFEASIVKGFSHVDTNDNNIADSNLYTGLTSMSIYVDLFGYRFIQDVEEGEPFITTNKNYINVNDESIGSPLTYFGESGSNLNTIFATILFDNFYGIELNTDSSISNDINGLSFFDNTNKMYLQDNTNIFSLGTVYKPLISINGNNILIQDINFLKGSDNNNAQMIANSGGVTRNNITIQNNILTKADIKFKFLDNHMIKLLVNNLQINDNTFISSSVSNGHEFLDIKGTNIASNKIFLNNFTSFTSDTGVIFTNNSDAYFYNNYISINTTLCEAIGSNLNATPLVSFLHTNNKAYYYYLGNFYQNNSGCVDGDGDGFCDSSYTSGTITDTNPLSSYPFDYTAHLLTAEFIVDNGAFNITLQSPLDTTNYEMTDGTGLINLTFSQDSLFPDLICDYILDGVSIYTEFNPSQNIQYTQTATGWTEKAYTFRVECFNDFQFETSNEITFNVTFAITPPINNETTTEDGGGFIGGLDVNNLFSDDPLESANAVKDNFKLLDRFFGTLTLVGFLAIFLSILFLIGGILFFFLK